MGKSTLTLADGTDATSVIEHLSRASNGSLSIQASSRHLVQLVEILREHGCTRQNLTELGRVIADPPSWCRIRGTWTILALLGKAGIDGAREASMITTLLAVAKDRAREAQATSPRPAPAVAPRDPAVVALATQKLREIEDARAALDPTRK